MANPVLDFRKNSVCGLPTAMVNPPVAKCSTIEAPEGTLDPNHKSTEHGTLLTMIEPSIEHWNQSTGPQPSWPFLQIWGNAKKFSASMQLSRDFLDCPTACYQHAPILDGIKYMKRNDPMEIQGHAYIHTSLGFSFQL